MLVLVLVLVLMLVLVCSLVNRKQINKAILSVLFGQDL